MKTKDKSKKQAATGNTRSGGVSRESQLGNATIVKAEAVKYVDPVPVSDSNVQSLLFCWCVSGSGIIEANGETYEFSRGNLLFLPWGHDITYKPDELRPFYIKTLHVVPAHDPKQELVAEVGSKNHPEALDSQHRKMVDHPMLRLATLIDDTDDANLSVLFNYALGVFKRETPPLPVARQMARLFLYEFFSLKRVF